jgi:hypothetical protein
MIDFSMDGKIPVLYQYFNDTTGLLTRVHNTKKVYSKTLKKLDKKRFIYYGKEGNVFYDVLSKYPINGKTALVWGLVGCNCDAIALWGNAKRVYVIDYNKPICDHEKIEVFTHDELKAKNIKTNFAFSYSSFEHDGLGRYGDPIDPNGDLRAMQDAFNSLYDDGILFLGIPMGQDTLCWNGCRIYGKYRLPLLLKGWSCLDVFDSYKKLNNMPFDLLQNGKNRQVLLVLKKIEPDYPDEALLLDAISNGNKITKNTNNPKMLAIISQYILDYKRG